MDCGLENSISYEEFEHEFEGIEYDEKSHTDYTNMTHTRNVNMVLKAKLKLIYRRLILDLFM